MTTMFVGHTVANYKAWRKVYDEVAMSQTEKGVTAQAVYQAVDNPNEITVSHDFTSVEAVKAFVDSEELKKQCSAPEWSARQQSGLPTKSKQHPRKDLVNIIHTYLDAASL